MALPCVGAPACFSTTQWRNASVSSRSLSSSVALFASGPTPDYRSLPGIRSRFGVGFSSMRLPTGVCVMFNQRVSPQNQPISRRWELPIFPSRQIRPEIEYLEKNGAVLLAKSLANAHFVTRLICSFSLLLPNFDGLNSSKCA